MKQQQCWGIIVRHAELVCLTGDAPVAEAAAEKNMRSELTLLIAANLQLGNCPAQALFHPTSFVLTHPSSTHLLQRQRCSGHQSLQHL